tara:strand:- start:649 stop:927 length:279 start_codon:yes stop_codon:yes gene_type:complete
MIESFIATLLFVGLMFVVMWCIYNDTYLLGFILIFLMLWGVVHVNINPPEANAQVTVSATIPCTLQNYQHSNCLPEELLQEPIKQCIYETAT